MRRRADDQFCLIERRARRLTQGSGFHAHADHLNRRTWPVGFQRHQNRIPWVIRARALSVAAAKVLPPRRPNKVMQGV